MAEEQRVIITDFDMSMGSMVGFMVKWVLASIPAALILAVLGGIVFAIVGITMGVLEQ